jgi:C2 domain/FerI (NUC094) domain
MWVVLTDPSDETQAINGYVRLTINVLGPGDKPPVHDPSKGLKDKNDNGVNELFTPSRVKLQGHVINFNVYRAEHLAPLDVLSNSVDPYIKISYAGAKAESRTVKENRNPHYNQTLSIAMKIPTMNDLVKVEIWDDDFAKDERVGTHYFRFKEIMKKGLIGPRWINFYGPPLFLGDDGDETYADLMSLYGDKGSTYRGRLLCSVETLDSDNPMTKTVDIPVKDGVLTNTIPVKAYSLKIALYEGIELPELTKDQVAIVATCGPYEVVSKFVENDNSRAIWNEMLDLKIRGPENPDDISDVILYLTTDANDPITRVSFKRIKAATLLDTNGKKFEIENYIFEEDKSLDKLDDEQFPGIIQARIKLYSTNTTDVIPPPEKLFKSQDDYTKYLLHVHLYMGRNFPPADETGAADPFVIVRCQGQRDFSSPKFETLNPGWFETLELEVSLPPLGDKEYPRPGISLLVYDQDTSMFGEKKDLLGRVWIDIEKKISQIESPVDGKKYPVLCHQEPTWYNLFFDATGKEEGQIYVGYDLILMDHRHSVSPTFP